ncbi:MAG: hypothetical protein HWN68_13185 [Desulfobacterales bacterium]|nr:hypothetical protein [Desulfobacterales bacterium]
MKKAMIALALAFVLGPAWYAAEGGAQMGPGMMGPVGSWYCPYCGRQTGHSAGYGMGPGMMGYGMGPGMMGRGYRHHYGQNQEPLKEKNAKSIIENYLKSARNPNLKVGNIKDVGNAFEAEILTKDKSLVDRLLVDKHTGWMRSVY